MSSPVVLLVLVVSAVLGAPVPPTLPAVSTTRLLQTCTGPVTHVCPSGKSSSLNVIYYDWESGSNRQDLLPALAGDSVSPNAVALFQVFQTRKPDNQTLDWDVFVLPQNGSRMGFPGTVPGTFPSPMMLHSAKWNGTDTFGPAGTQVDVWINDNVWQKGNSQVTLTSTATGDVVGYRMPQQGVIQEVLGPIVKAVPTGVFQQPTISA